MRTTIDMPDVLYRRAKTVMAQRGLTFRSLVIDALEQTLSETTSKPFVLREASAGYSVKKGGVSRQRINEAIDLIREPKRGS